MADVENPYAPPKAEEPLPEPPREIAVDDVSRGARIAGVLLMSNALLIAVERMALSSRIPSNSMGGVLPIVIDFVIGGSLALRVPRLKPWAILRCALGGVFGSVLHLTNGDYPMVALQLILSGSLLALLIGDAGKTRIGIACAGFGLYLLAELVGLASVL